MMSWAEKLKAPPPTTATTAAGCASSVFLSVCLSVCLSVFVLLYAVSVRLCVTARPSVCLPACLGLPKDEMSVVRLSSAEGLSYCLLMLLCL